MRRAYDRAREAAVRALRSLSAQYEREQRSAAVQIAGLSRQVTTLRQQVEQL